MSMSPFARIVRATLALAAFVAAYLNWVHLPIPIMPSMTDEMPITNIGPAYILAGLLLGMSVFTDKPMGESDTPSINKEPVNKSEVDLVPATSTVMTLMVFMICVWAGTGIYFAATNGPWLPFLVLVVAFSWFATQIPKISTMNAAHIDKSPVP